MAKFDVYPNTSKHSASTPYLLDVQSDLFSGLDTRMVIPLRSLEYFPEVKLPGRLTPVFSVDGQDCLLETPKMAAIPARELKQPVINLSNEQAVITGALDFLFQGYE
ncbi:MAG: CcdB family protein [Limnobacter sp.]|nr:CcdB family protein [Limnobacter sp.]